MKTKKIVSYLLLFFWMYVIFYLSNQSGSVSGGESGKIINSILTLLHIPNKEIIIEYIHNPLRECMHAFEYFILGILMMNVLKQNNIKQNNVLISVLICFIYATTDEIHQLFVPNRTFEYIDIFLDIIGGLIGSYLFKLIIFRKKLRKS